MNRVPFLPIDRDEPTVRLWTRRENRFPNFQGNKRDEGTVGEGLGIVPVLKPVVVWGQEVATGLNLEQPQILYPRLEVVGREKEDTEVPVTRNE